MFRIKLSTRILIYFMLVSLVPLFVNNYLLVSSANNELLKAAGSKQQALASYLSENVENYLGSNVTRLRYLATTYSDPGAKTDDVERNMAVSFNQNLDLERLTIVNQDGQELYAFDENGRIDSLEDKSDSDAFKAVRFLGGKDYVSTVNYSDEQNPTITIAVPILSSDFTKNLDNLDQANFGTYTKPEDIKGAVIAEYSIQDLWQTVLSTEIGKGGYAYIVDGLGNLVAHPNSEFLKNTKKVSNIQAVSQLINNNFDTSQTTSETGEQVISTPKVIPNSGWALIVQEPEQHIYATVNAFIRLAVIVGVLTAVLALILSIFFRRRLSSKRSSGRLKK